MHIYTICIFNHTGPAASISPRPPRSEERNHPAQTARTHNAGTAGARRATGEVAEPRSQQLYSGATALLLHRLGAGLSLEHLLHDLLLLNEEGTDDPARARRGFLGQRPPAQDPQVPAQPVPTAQCAEAVRGAHLVRTHLPHLAPPYGRVTDFWRLDTRARSIGLKALICTDERGDRAGQTKLTSSPLHSARGPAASPLPPCVAAPALPPLAASPVGPLRRRSHTLPRPRRRASSTSAAVAEGQAAHPRQRPLASVLAARRSLAALAHVLNDELAARRAHFPDDVRLGLERLAAAVRHALHHGA